MISVLVESHFLIVQELQSHMGIGRDFVKKRDKLHIQQLYKRAEIVAR